MRANRLGSTASFDFNGPCGDRIGRGALNDRHPGCCGLPPPGRWAIWLLARGAAAPEPGGPGYEQGFEVDPMKNARLLFVGVIGAALAFCPLSGAVGAERGLSPIDQKLVNSVVQLIQYEYVHKIGAHKLTVDMLKGLMARLDPHSDYMDEPEFKESQANISGKFGGLGIEITEQHGVPKVISPIDGTPAAKAGLEPGDLIVAINGDPTNGVGLNKIVRTLRGKPGSKVTITILRGTKKRFDVTITRAIISVQTVKSKLEPNNIGYVRITEFGGTTPADFKKAIKAMTKKAGGHLNGVVLDLRNDPGGLLTAAVAVAGNFLDGGTVVSIHGRHKDDDETYKAAKGGMSVPKSTPMVVLINGASASASEIVAGAMQDRGRATIMGTQSFGKGSVQTIIPLDGHGALRLTTALYYTPSGRSIQGRGITPNVVVDAAKDVQVAGVLPRESTLHGSFHNPGSLINGKVAPKDIAKPTAKPDLSPPIKPQLIATDKDNQLKAALALIDKKAGDTTTAGSSGTPSKD
jgi:carboxyl-terminal processing protease